MRNGRFRRGAFVLRFASLAAHKKPVILTDIQTLGRRDGRTVSGYACALRAVNAPDAANVSIAKLPYDLIERVVQRITSQIPGINHVLYDVTGKPVAMAEWA